MLTYFFLFMFVTGCIAQNHAQKTTKSKTFDIETFEKNKIDNEYKIVTKDSTEIIQGQWHSGYDEIIKYKESHIQTYNKYYSTGTLKLTGDFYPRDFEKGIWKEYDEQGHLIKETDYDAPYTFTWEDILKLIKDRKFDMNAYGFEVSRNFGFGRQEETTEEPFWAITHNKSEEDMLLGVIIIDGVTGKIIKEYNEPYPSEE